MFFFSFCSVLNKSSLNVSLSRVLLLKVQVLIAQTLDSSFQGINHYPVDTYYFVTQPGKSRNFNPAICLRHQRVLLSYYALKTLKWSLSVFSGFGDTKFDEIMSVLQGSWFTVNERASVRLRMHLQRLSFRFVQLK